MFTMLIPIGINVILILLAVWSFYRGKESYGRPVRTFLSGLTFSFFVLGSALMTTGNIYFFVGYGSTISSAIVGLSFCTLFVTLIVLYAIFTKKFANLLYYRKHPEQA
jgi:hypothetical protein